MPVLIHTAIGMGSYALRNPVIRCFFALALFSSALWIPGRADANPVQPVVIQEGGAHLVLINVWKKVEPSSAVPTSVVMPMSSMQQCRSEGSRVMQRNSNYKTSFWCIKR